MSWFKRIPRVKEQSVQYPKHFSPYAEKILKESKDAVRAKDPPKKKPKKD